MVVKSKERRDHVTNLKETFEMLRKYKLKLNASKCAFGVNSGKFLGHKVTRRGIKANPNQISTIQNLASPRTTKEDRKLIGIAVAQLIYKSVL